MSMTRAYTAAIEAHIGEGGSSNPHEIPSIRAVSRKKIRDFDKKEVMAEKLGADTARDECRPRLAAPRYNRIGAHLEIDTTFINVVFQLNSGGDPVERKCAVYQVIDGATDAWLAHAVRFEAPNGDLSGRAFYRAILPTAACSFYGDGQPMVVIPEAVTLDRGLEAHNGRIQAGLWGVHVEDMVTPRRLGRAKPDVERLNGTFKGKLPEGGLKLIVDDLRDGEPVSKSEAQRLMLCQLDAAIKDLREEYLDDPHSAHNGQSPRQVFEKMMNDVVLAPPPPSSRDRVAALRFCEETTDNLTNQGVEIDGCRYQAAATAGLLPMTAGEQFTILRSRDDLSRIGILVPGTREIIELKLIYPLEAAKMTEDQWWEFRRPARLSQRHGQRIARIAKKVAADHLRISAPASAAATHESAAVDVKLQSLTNDNAAPPPAAGPVSEAESAEASFWLPRSSSTSQT